VRVGLERAMASLVEGARRDARGEHGVEARPAEPVAPGAADVHRVVGERVVAGDVAGLVVGGHHVAPRRVERRGRAVERDHALVRVVAPGASSMTPSRMGMWKPP
jgi:hypothetical protein